jgi:hypothetical protein
LTHQRVFPPEITDSAQFIQLDPNHIRISQDIHQDLFGVELESPIEASYWRLGKKYIYMCDIEMFGFSCIDFTMDVS